MDPMQERIEREKDGIRFEGWTKQEARRFSQFRQRRDDERFIWHRPTRYAFTALFWAFVAFVLYRVVT